MGNTVRWTKAQMDAYRLKYGQALDKLKPAKPAPTATKRRRSKYGAKKIVVDGEKFDSQKEYDRWLVLQQMQASGLISNLSRQTRFELAPAVKLDGQKTKPALRYFADATYMKDGVFVVEDTKSWITRKKDSYRIKKHLMKSVHNIDITET